MSTVRIHNHGPEPIDIVDGNGQVTSMGEGGSNLFVTPVHIEQYQTPAQITEIAPNPNVPKLPAEAAWPFPGTTVHLGGHLAGPDAYAAANASADPFADAPAMKTDDLGPGNGQTGEAGGNSLSGDTAGLALQ